MERVTGKNLERFFHDWTERPGNPVLDIAVEFLPDNKQLRIAVKQTQASEPFHFTLPIAITTGVNGAPPVWQRLQIDDREQVVYFPLDQAPVRVEVDPNQTVLAEFNVTKSRELWRYQLASGISVASHGCVSSRSPSPTRTGHTFFPSVPCQ